MTFFEFILNEFPTLMRNALLGRIVFKIVWTY